MAVFLFLYSLFHYFLLKLIFIVKKHKIMKVILSEAQLGTCILNEMLSEYNVADGNAFHNPYAKKIKNGQDALKKLIKQYGKIMINIDNGKEYCVYEIYSLAELLGIRYCLCRLIKDNEPYGQIAVKPLIQFKDKNY